ncbi:MAG: L-rhamnose isomerase [Acholeplasmataceae bacterium]|nr:L-rhamnose isomerase [Acholeplasmataceae bacterium]
MKTLKQNYDAAKKTYATYGIDTDSVIKKLQTIPVSIHCWQLDDITGFEQTRHALSGGIQVTGNHEGKPQSIDEFKDHVRRVFKLIPGSKKLNLHAIYLDSDDAVDRDAIEPTHYESWVLLAKELGIGLDFNPTCFSHPKSAGDLTLSSPDESIRSFWIEHVRRSRRISEYFGRSLGIPSVTNIWVPDGSKELPVDTLTPRRRLKDSLDRIFEDPIDHRYAIDSLESKLFGIGTESYVVGSHEFYTNYAATSNHAIVCLDSGHFHPTETISQKISAYLAFGKSIALHISRPVRWDSDHVVLLNDETIATMKEIARHNAFHKVHIGLDFFDGSIDRIAATVIGARNVQKALMIALLEPVNRLIEIESEGDTTQRMVLSEEIKSLPFGYVWDYYCHLEGVPGSDWYHHHVKHGYDGA